MPNCQLYHVGVKGMKWGHHVKTQEPINVSKAKSKVLDTKTQLKNVNKQYNKETLYGMVKPSDKTSKKQKDVVREHKYAKEDLSKVKILNKLETKGKSSYQLKMEEKYKSKGMTDDEAAVAAYNNIKTKKILAVVGTAVLVVGAYKLHSEYVDKIIKAGTNIQNISSAKDKGLRDVFYSSNNKMDNLKYKGLYGSVINGEGAGTVKKNVGIMKDIKRASPKNAQKILADIIDKDPEFAKSFNTYLKEEVSNGKLSPGYITLGKTAESGLLKGKLNKQGYEVFNAALVDHSPEMQKLSDRYFKELSEKGYNAIKDVNDSKYSGYDTKNPMIVFNAKEKIKLLSVDDIPSEDIKKASDKVAKIMIAQELPSAAAELAGIVAVGTSINKIGISAINNRKIKKYKESNPNTKLSNTEIIRMLERSA